MSIRRLFDATWDQVYKGAVGYGDSDILTDQRLIIVNRNVKRFIWGQLIMMFEPLPRTLAFSHCLPTCTGAGEAVTWCRHCVQCSV